jgi:hypothetical protein
VRTPRVILIAVGLVALSVTVGPLRPLSSHATSRSYPKIADLAGADRIVAKGTNPTTGEVCRGAASI